MHMCVKKLSAIATSCGHSGSVNKIVPVFRTRVICTNLNWSPISNDIVPAHERGLSPPWSLL